MPSLASGLGDEARNIGEATIDGIELLLSGNLISERSFSVPFSITATFTNAEFDTSTGVVDGDRYSGGSADNQIPYIPEV